MNKRTLLIMCAIFLFGIDGWMMIPLTVFALWKMWNIEEDDE